MRPEEVPVVGSVLPARVEDLPVVGRVVESGPDDHLFDSLLLLGPVLVSIIALLGRSMGTEVVGIGYLGFFAGYIAYKGLVGSDTSRENRSSRP